jgi:ferredoxin-NADP reductase
VTPAFPAASDRGAVLTEWAPNCTYARRRSTSGELIGLDYGKQVVSTHDRAAALEFREVAPDRGYAPTQLARVGVCSGRGRYADMLEAIAPAPSAHPHTFVCGPTPFVENVANLLVSLGHEPRSIRAERFGPTGG